MSNISTYDQFVLSALMTGCLLMAILAILGMCLAFYSDWNTNKRDTKKGNT
jgi:hypothetical protein